MSFTFPIRNEMEAYAQAKAITDKLIADGFTTEAPGLEVGEEREVIVTVMRRAKPKDDTVIIDFYTEWGAGTDEPFGTYKYQHLYMDKDKPEMIAEFLKFSGFKRIEDIPLYDGQNPLKRTFGKKNPKETAVPTPFKIVKKQGAEKTGSDGKVFRPWEFVRYESIVTPSQPVTVPASKATEATEAGSGDDLETELRRKALTALDNEEVTIYSAHYNTLHNGQGHPRWEAKARVIDGASIPVVIWTEHEKLIKKAGYTLPRDADDLDIPVITKVKGSERNITSVKAIDGTWMTLEQQTAANANVAGNNVFPDDPPAWIFDRVMLLTKLGKVAPQVSYQERGATADKMHRDGEFDKVSNLDSAVTLVVNRLAAHSKAAVNQ